MKSKPIIVVVLFSLILVLLSIFAVQNNFGDPYFGSHLALVRVSEENNYIALEPFSYEGLASLHDQINSISKAWGLTLLLFFLKILAGINIEILKSIPLGILLVFLPLYLLSDLFLKDKFTSFIVSSITFLDLSIFNLVFNLNTHSWALFLFLMFIYLVVILLEKNLSSENVIKGSSFYLFVLLILVLFSMSTVYYTASFFSVIFLLSLVSLLFLLRLVPSRTLVILGLFTLLAFVFVFILNGFFTSLISNLFEKSTTLPNFISGFFSNLLNTLFSENSYKSTTDTALRYSPIINYLGILFYLFIILGSINLVYTLFLKKSKRRLEPSDLVLISILLVMFIQPLVYLFFNQFVTYFILLFGPLVFVYSLRNLDKKKVFNIIIVIFITLILIKLSINFFGNPIYDRDLYQDYTYSADWVALEINSSSTSFILSDIYFAEEVISNNPSSFIKGFYKISFTNNVDFIYSGEEEDQIQLDNSGISYIVVTTVNNNEQVPLMYGIAGLLSSFNTPLNSSSQVNLIYSSGVGEIFWIR